MKTREDVSILKTLADSLSGFNLVVLHHLVPDNLTEDQTVVKFLSQDLSRHLPDRHSLRQKFDLSSILELSFKINFLLTLDLQSKLDLLSTSDLPSESNLLLATTQEGNFVGLLKDPLTFSLCCLLDVCQFRLIVRIISELSF